MTREIVFDVETTGLSPGTGDRITEIGCVEVIDFLPTGESYQTYINPERDVPPEVVRITGLTTEFLADKPLFEDIADAFLDFVGDASLVAHNAQFDKGFINAELCGLKRDPFEDERFIDTLDIARRKFPGGYHSLDALCKRFEIGLEARDKHGALIDAQLLAEVYLELNGGRERRLDLFRAREERARAGLADQIKRAPRPVPLAPLSTDDELAAHAALLESLGAKPLWRKFGG